MSIRRRRVALLLPAVVVAAVVTAPWLPFVNATHLWLGLPPMLLWTSGCALAVTPALLAVEAARGGADDEERGR